MHRQLGLKLHVLDPTKLPLYDGLTGQLIPDDMDLHVNGVRDMLLDAAREHVDTLGEAAVDGMAHVIPADTDVILLLVRRFVREAVAALLVPSVLSSHGCCMSPACIAVANWQAGVLLSGQ